MAKILDIQSHNYPLVALVGRANVGKSTLFNRLVEMRKAVTAAVPGTTRDINIGYCDWRATRFMLADTGGYVPKPATELEKSVRRQAENVLKRADAVIFLTDAQAGFTPLDMEFLKVLRKAAKKNVVFVANKADSLTAVRSLHDPEWMRAGLGAPFPVSAASGLGVGDLLDQITPLVQHREQVDRDELKIAIIGRTNAGKSSLLNKILGEERVIVSAEEHTTREPQDTPITYDSVPIKLIDTVGIRRKSRVEPGIEREGVMRSIETIQRADVVLFVLDGTQTPSRQESRLARMAEDAGSGIVFVINKWDLVEEKDPNSTVTFERYFKDFFSFVAFAPCIFISALSGQRVGKVIDLALAVQQQRMRTLSQKELDTFLKKALTKQKPAWIRGRKKPVVTGFSQTGTKPPTFGFIVNDRTTIQYAYLRYLENRLREQFGFVGTPIRIHTEQ